MSRMPCGQERGKRQKWISPLTLAARSNELGSNVDRLKGNFGSFHFQPRLHLAEWVSHTFHIRQGHWNNRMIHKSHQKLTTPNTHSTKCICTCIGGSLPQDTYTCNRVLVKEKAWSTVPPKPEEVVQPEMKCYCPSIATCTCTVTI